MSEVDFIRRYGENTRQCYGISLIRAIAEHPETTPEINRIFTQIWADFELNNKYRETPFGSDEPVSVWRNIQAYQNEETKCTLFKIA